MLFIYPQLLKAEFSYKNLSADVAAKILGDNPKTVAK